MTYRPRFVFAVRIVIICCLCLRELNFLCFITVRELLRRSWRFKLTLGIIAGVL